MRVTRKLLLAVLLAATVVDGRAQTPVDTGNTGGTQIYTDAGAHGAAHPHGHKALIAAFTAHVARALRFLKLGHNREALAELNPYLDRDDPLREDPSGIVSNGKLAEGYYARGLALERVAANDAANAKPEKASSDADFKQAETLDHGIDARMARKGFPRQR
jgi:hypothetical protein